jgi:hypothetical protein
MAKPERKNYTPLSFLTEQEKDALELLIQNQSMREGLRKVLLDQVINQGVQRTGEESLMQRNWIHGYDPENMLTDADFGRLLRTHREALIIVEHAINKIFELVPEETPKEEKPRHI